MIGKKLNIILKIDAKHALYSESGNWYHHLTKFPGVLFDKGGYLIFYTKQDYERNPKIKGNKEITITDGISSIEGYKCFSKDQIKKISKAIVEGTLFTRRGRSGLKRNRSKRFMFTSSKPLNIINILRNKTEFNAIIEVNQSHRNICKGLYNILSKKYGKGNIGCDCSTGRGTYIDMIRREGDEYIFYEIKTYKDLRKSIREAFGQLMEYNYWTSNNLAREMIIVTDKKITNEVRYYLEFLRNTFFIPIYYQQFDLKKSLLLAKY